MIYKIAAIYTLLQLVSVSHEAMLRSPELPKIYCNNSTECVDGLCMEHLNITTGCIENICIIQDLQQQTKLDCTNLNCRDGYECKACTRSQRYCNERRLYCSLKPVSLQECGRLGCDEGQKCVTILPKPTFGLAEKCYPQMVKSTAGCSKI